MAGEIRLKRSKQAKNTTTSMSRIQECTDSACCVGKERANLWCAERLTKPNTPADALRFKSISPMMAEVGETDKRESYHLKPNKNKTQLNMNIDISGLLDGFSNLVQVLMKTDFYMMVLGAVTLCLLVILVAVLKHP